MFPILYESGRFSIQTVWVMVTIALLFSSYLAIERLRRARLNFNLLIAHSTFLLIWALIGARLGFWLMHSDIYWPNWNPLNFLSLFMIWDRGLSFWGATLAVGGALFYQIRRNNENLADWADALSVPWVAGCMIGLVGAFLGGYSYGIPTELPWGITYESFNVKYTVPVHPTQLYAIFGLALLLFAKKQMSLKTEWLKPAGNTALLVSSGVSGLSFFLEFLRGDDTLLFLGIRVPQIGFLFLFVASSIILYRRFKPYFHGSSQTI